MLLRSLSAFIVLFWVVSTGWLIRSVWFGSETRFEPVDPEVALGAFFQWNETSTLTILENGNRIGQMVANGAEGRDPRTGALIRGLSTQGNLDDRIEGIPGNESLMGTSWRMSADFDETTKLKAFQLALRIPRQDLNVRLEVDGEPPALAARATVGETVLYESGVLSVDEPSTGRKRSEESGKATSGGLIPGGAIASLLPGGGAMSDIANFYPTVEASRGSLEIAGSLQPVYLVKVNFGSEKTGTPIRIYFSEAGEPWRIDTGWGYEAVAEVLIPVDELEK
ncbi:MAG: hypothetical protein KDN20_07855 [Verrucomicrobiae bacterium]|nr:hypothetical protein [Verrucomicrobiae bacterium]